MKNVLIVFGCALFLVNCNSGNKKKETYSDYDKATTTANHPGKALMENNFANGSA